MGRWRICIKNPFLNCAAIYPIQQKKVRQVVDCAAVDSNVNRVVIFGSSTRVDCHVGSDVDIYVELQEERKFQLPGIRFVYDLWTNFTVDQAMLEEIKKSGVIVYERGNAFG